MSSPSRVYFSGLNGLRFIAASLIIVHHIEQYKFWMNIPSYWDTPVIDAIGHQSVSLFFVLSGFLITYLLLAENQKFGDIDIKYFYLRRILRIWPLYFLIVFACLTLPYVIELQEFTNIERPKMIIALPMLLLILPNVIRLISGSIIGGNQLWSIGVEEQFYIIWPWLVRFFRNNVQSFLFLFISLKLVISISTYCLTLMFPNMKIWSILYSFWELFQVEQMAIGALGAYYLFEKKEKVLSFLFSLPSQIICICLMILMCLFNPKGMIVTYLEAAVYLIFIMNVSCNKKFFIQLENKYMSKLGTFSYSIYMYHTLAIAVCIYCLKVSNLCPNNFWFNIWLYIGSYALTLLLSFLSYEYFETPFLKIKEGFMKVKSSSISKVD